MMDTFSYRNAFITALGLHVFLAFLLLFESTHQRPVLMSSNELEMTQSESQPMEHPAQAIKAVSVDNQEVMNTIQRLQEEKQAQRRAEEKRQQMLTKQADDARHQRIEEQQHLAKLKDEAAKLAITRQKQIVEEQNRLKQLAKEKAEQEKHLADMKQQQIQLQKQQQDAEKLAQLKKKQNEELARETEARALKAKAELAQKQQAAAAAQQAALDSQKTARMSGEVDKYKAMIINAISQQWILPENVNSSLSSQFRIRLAPNGVVLDVNLTRSSGDAILDRSAQSAIFKASPLPVPTDPDTFNIFRDISLTVRPESARG
jgi:colicin import membrane protein